MWKWWKVVALMVLAGIGIVGLKRARFETDVLAVLPADMPEVAALLALQRVFSEKGELILLLETDEDGAGGLAGHAEELAKRLDRAGASYSVRWQPRWRDDPTGMAELFGWLWMNGDPLELAALEASLSPEQIEGTMAKSIERVATAMDGLDMVQSAHDPIGFLGHSSLGDFFEGSRGGGEGFANAEETAQLVFIDAPRPVSGYREVEAWLGEVRAVVEPWAAETGIAVGYTGDPSFEAEIGGAMEGDMSGTVGITSVLIASLFLLMQRRAGLLAGLVVTLGLVFVTTLGMAGWIFGSLSIMAAGFAAILLGLAVDYGVLICQEAKVSGHDQRAVQEATGRSICWAAATTATVFFALNLSGLPGIAQLGSVVGMGVIFGAIFMLGIYLPWVVRAGGGRPIIGHKNAWIPPRRGSIGILALMALTAGAVLATKGLPGVEFDRSLLRPRNSPSMKSFERIAEVFPEWNSPAIRLVIEGDRDDVVRQRMDALRADLAKLDKNRPGMVEGVSLPVGWWPSAQNIEANAGRSADSSKTGSVSSRRRGKPAFPTKAWRWVGRY